MTTPRAINATVRRLRLVMGVFFLALTIPTIVLIYQAYSRLKWEAFHQHQVLAEELITRLDRRLRQLIEAEEKRPFSDYAFLTVAGAPTANFVQRSPLAAFPLVTDIPGVLGYFQVDSAGNFTTPSLPEGVDNAALGIPLNELIQRQALGARLQQVLSQNRLVRATVSQFEKKIATNKMANALAEADLPAAAGEGSGQAVFDSLNQAAPRQLKQKASSALGRVDDLARAPALPEKFEKELPALAAGPGETVDRERRLSRKERGAVVELQDFDRYTVPAAKMSEEAKADLRVRIFESEIDPFEFSVLDSGQFVLFRKVWRGGARYVQGLLLEPTQFLAGAIGEPFQAASVARMSELGVAYQDQVLATYQGRTDNYVSRTEALRGTLLYQSRLSAPLSALQVVLSIQRMPVGAGASVLGWASAVLAVVLCGGLWLMYRLGLGQIKLARQQQDFVSAVSHELKTPLTSIRMYSEMLREGWAAEPKKAEYYAYIHDESERLSRLINNVLNLARMTRDELKVELKAVTVGELMDVVRSKVTTMVAQAGSELRLECAPALRAAMIEVDQDCFTQIILNLVDNALKFSAQAATHTVEITARADGARAVIFAVRDYGPGISPEQRSKIFELFYRAENAMTRETSGTGIGLALVRRLAAAMSARVAVVDAAPGAEFQLRFPCR